jgi:hypothetical protein
MAARSEADAQVVDCKNPLPFLNPNNVFFGQHENQWLTGAKF